MTDPALETWFAQARAVPIEEICARRSIKLKRQGAEFVGPCPKCAGDDRFAINVSKQVFNCRGCGAKGHAGVDFVAWLDGIEPTPAAERLNGPPPKANGKDHIPEPREVTRATFVYEDESSKTLFAVGRIEFQNWDGSFVLKDAKRKKTFKQKRPDPDNPGKWIYNVDGVRVIPYRLPELIEAIGSGYTVLIVEGEAKVDLLRKWNVPSTCCSQGAKHWKAEHAEFLRGAEVVILPDNDKTGRDHADVVGASLQGVAAAVHVLELPDLPPKGDILDWVKAGGTREKLDELLRQAKPWAPRGAEEEKREEQHQEEHPQASESDASSGERAETVTPLRWLDMSNWDNEPRPERDWTIRDRVPANQAGLFSGEGGTGKSIIEMMKDVAHVTAKDWLGSMPEPGPAFYLGAEDDQKEIHIRFYDIAAHYGVTFKELIAGGLRVLCQLGEDATLCAATGKSGRVETTALYRQIYEAAGDVKPRNISVDTLSRAFAGNEIDRVQVYAFAMHMQALAMVAGGSVTVLSHPSLSGITSGSGISGSTAWHGAFRFRQYLKSGPKNTDDEQQQPDDGLRQFEFKKNQYGPLGETILVRYRQGLFLPEPGMAGLDKIAREAKADRVFLDLLKRFANEGRNVGDKTTAPNFGPAVFAKEDEAKTAHLRKSDLEAAMRRLFADSKIHVENYGRPSRPASRIASK
jgi:RecA-family ATPase